jgi:hypothetical protein
MTAHRVRFFDYVSQPFQRVQAALRDDAAGIFMRATHAEANRDGAHSASLRVNLGALHVSTAVRVAIGPPEDTQSSPLGYPITQFPLTWKSEQNPALFPELEATLLVYPLSSHETQLELEGTYDPPLGVVGDVIDAAVGHRLAEPSLFNFLRDVAARLRLELTDHAAREAG